MSLPHLAPYAPVTLQLPSRSMGIKLLVICMLAVAMTMPSFFVSRLVEERSQHATASTQQTQSAAAPQPVLPGTSIHLVDSYRSVTRSLKYVLLFLGLVFATYFGLEVTTGRRVHAAQYVLVGIAQLIFYLLLLSLAEEIGFDLAFLLAGTATVSLLATNAGWVFAGRAHGTKALLAFSILYTVIYLLLRLEKDALLIGAIASFATVAFLMYLTRHLDWYGTPQTALAPQPPTPPSSMPVSI